MKSPSLKEATVGFGATEILLILVVVVVLFGARKLPELGRGMGQAIREFRGAKNSPEETNPPKT